MAFSRPSLIAPGWSVGNSDDSPKSGKRIDTTGKEKPVFSDVRSKGELNVLLLLFLPHLASIHSSDESIPWLIDC